MRRINFGIASLLACVVGSFCDTAWGQRPVLPGSGSEIVGVADDFEDPNWNYIRRDPQEH